MGRLDARSKKRGPVSARVIERLCAIVGPQGVVRDADALAPYLRSWRDSWVGAVPLLLRPENTQQVSQIVRICAETDTALVPQGGNTGLTGASQPHDDNSEIIVSLARMNKIRALDLQNDTMTVEAGCILQQLQEYARDSDRLLPLSLAAEGSCQIGGNLSTNAGGTQVLRYGNARNLVLGIEAVLPDGRIWDGLRGLRKDNTGYDLKHLFIGAEGTLGIITAAVLKLFPRPQEEATALVALPDPAAAVALLGQMRAAIGDQVTGFEIMGRNCIEITQTHLPSLRDPFAQAYPWYVLVQLSGQGNAVDLDQQLETVLAGALENEIVLDAVIAQSEAQAAQLWQLREAIPEAQNHLGASIKHDVSVPVSQIPRFLAQTDAALEDRYPGLQLIAFGHIGDGNIHYNPAHPPDMPAADFYAETDAVNLIVHDQVASLGGSISAEHGLGRLRLGEAERYKSGVELDLMRTIKRALDPQDIMNPGKVVRLTEPE